MKHIRLKYNSKDNYFDMIVPFSFVFKCQVSIREWKEEQEYRIEGDYIYDSYIDLTAEQIMKGWYPEHTEFCIKDNDAYVSIPLCDLECEYIEEENKDWIIEKLLLSLQS